MTLDEAIAHAERERLGQGGCAEDHGQLAGWLQELRLRRDNDTRRVEQTRWCANCQILYLCFRPENPCPVCGGELETATPEPWGAWKRVEDVAAATAELMDALRGALKLVDDANKNAADIARVAKGVIGDSKKLSETTGKLLRTPTYPFDVEDKP